MTAFDFMTGDSDYRAAAEREGLTATGGWADGKTTADLEQQVNALQAKYADLQRDHTAVGGKHDALFRAVEALTKDPNLSQKARTRIRAVLVNHIKEWTQS